MTMMYSRPRIHDKARKMTRLQMSAHVRRSAEARLDQNKRCFAFHVRGDAASRPVRKPYLAVAGSSSVATCLWWPLLCST